MHNYKSHIPRSAVIISNGCSAISGGVGNSKGAVIGGDCGEGGDGCNQKVIPY